ncbi:MAG: chemotaxis protein CheW [Waterburya sp.]
MNQEYFTVEIASEITLGLLLSEMDTVTQLETQNICTVPGVEDFWYGVVNFKGSLLWILDSDRFFNLDQTRHKPPQKLTAVVVKNSQLGDEKRVAIATQQLKGIVSIEPSCCKPISDDISPQLRQCCSTVAQIDPQMEGQEETLETTVAQSIYLLDSAALLQQLHQKSMLIST